MTVRRLAAFGLAATIMHLNVARADVVCAAHGDMSAHTAHVDDAAPGQSERGPSDAKCDSPSQRDCCEAMVSCSIVLGMGDAVRVAPAMASQATVVVASVSAPASRVAAPDPPPPRI